MAAIPLQHEPEIEYPDSDGKPIAETPLHLDVMVHLIQGLQSHFADDPDVYVGGNMLLYYEVGKLSRVAPDVFVARGVPKGDRDVYLLWREPRAPCFILEVTSAATREEDETWKKALYAQFGVEEYFLFDPRGEYLEPRLQGLCLTGGEYQPLPLAADGSLIGQTIGIAFRPEGKALRMIDLKTDRLIPTYSEVKAIALAAEAARKAAEEWAEAETRAVEAEARFRALAEELERLQRQP